MLEAPDLSTPETFINIGKEAPGKAKGKEERYGREDPVGLPRRGRWGRLCGRVLLCI